MIWCNNRSAETLSVMLRVCNPSFHLCVRILRLNLGILWNVSIIKKNLFFDLNRSHLNKFVSKFDTETSFFYTSIQKFSWSRVHFTVDFSSDNKTFKVWSLLVTVVSRSSLVSISFWNIFWTVDFAENVILLKFKLD